MNEALVMSGYILFDLPEDFSRLVLVEWISVNDVTRLDSAFCSRELRKHFVPLAYNPLTVFAGTTGLDVDLKPVLDWAVTRKAHLDGIVINYQLLHSGDLLSDFLSLSGPAILWVTISYFRSDIEIISEHVLIIAKWCPNIQQLKVRGEQTEHIAAFWGKHVDVLTKSCRKLTDLSLRYIELTAQRMAAALNRCEGLQRLAICNYVGGAIPVEIAIPTLKSLECRSPGLTDAVLRAIGQRCAKLEKLIVFRSEQQGTDVGVRAVLQGCPLLQETDVEYAEGISTELRMELARRRNLTALRTRDWVGMDDELAQGVLKASPNLIRLMCNSCCEWLTDVTLAVCAQHCPRVQHIELLCCPRITNNAVRVLVSSLVNLRSVDLSGCSQLTDDTMLAIAEHCPALERILCAINVSDAAVVKLAEGCAELSYVYLFGTQVGDAGLTALAAHCSKLQALFLFRCPCVTAQAVQRVMAGCSRLEKMGLPVHLKGQQLPHLANPPMTLTISYA
jgi:hypothetical protein